MEKKNVLIVLVIVLLLLLLLIFIGSNMSNSKSSDKDKEGEGTDTDDEGDGSGSGSGSGSVGEAGENDENTTGSAVPGQGGLLPGLTGNLTEDQLVIKNLEYHKYTGLQAAEKVELFIRSMRKQDGNYYFAESCNDEKSGPEQVQNNNWAIMAYSALYDKTRKDVYKSRLISDWDISAADKTSASLYTSFQLYQLYLVSGKYPILTEIDREGLFRKITSVGSSAITGYEPGEDYAMIIATLSRASFMSSMIVEEKELDGSPEIYNNAEELLQKAKDRGEIVLLEKNGVKFEEGSCWIELANLQKYDLTKENALLEESKEFFTNLDLSSEFDTPKLLDSSIPMNLLPCAEALLELHKRTGDGEFLTDARSILQAYLKYNWDIPERKFCSEDYGLLAKRLTSDEDGRKIMTDNAYFIYLLSDENMQNYEFKWLK